MIRRSLPRRPLLLAVAVLALLLALAPAAPARAGLFYEAVTTTSGDGGTDTTTARAWIDGPNAKIEFVDSDQPVFQEGSYLLTENGGRTMVLVDPDEETYTEIDLEATMQNLSSMMESMGNVVNMEIENPEVETLEQGPGGELLGRSTTRTRYRTSYTMKIKVLGMGRENAVETLQEVWTTTAVGDDAGLGVWMRKEPPATGNPGLDELIAQESAKIQGFPLKTVTESTTRGGRRGNRETTTRTETVVTTLEERDIPASTFELPGGYEKVDNPMLSGQGGEEEDGGNPLRGLFGGGDG